MHATSAERRTPAQSRGIDRRALLLDTVERLLQEQNFRDLSVAQVMSEAGLPRTTFYRYFPDLESILLLGVARVSEELGDAAVLWLHDATDPVASLTPAAHALVDVYQRHGRLLLAFAEAAASAPSVEVAWQAAVGSFVDLAAARIHTLVDAGRCDVRHPDETATALIWMTERFLLETYGRGPGGSTGTSTEVLELIWRRTLFP